MVTPKATTTTRKNTKRKNVDETSPASSENPKQKIRPTVDAPAKWSVVYEIISNQRKRISAPVDTMGCASAGNAEGISEKVIYDLYYTQMSIYK